MAGSACSMIYATSIVKNLLQIRTDEVDEVFGEIGGDLLFRAIDQVEADVGFKDFAHQSVDAAPDSGQEHELAATILVGVDETFHRVELAAKAADSLKQLHLFTFL